MGGSTQADTKTTTQVLTPEQQSLVALAQPGYQQFAASNITQPGSSSVAPFDPLQVQGQNQVLGTTGTQSGVVGSAAGANQLATSGALLDPTTNLALRATQDAATRPLYDNLNEHVLPGIATDSSTGAGGVSANFGGSRQGIAEGLAIKGTQQAAKDTNAQIATHGYDTGLNALLTGTAQAPGTAAAQTIPGTTTSTVGDVRQQQAQQSLTADTAADRFAQWLPLIKAQLLTQGASGTPGGSATSTGTSNKSADPISTLIGLLSAGGGAAGGASKLISAL